VQHASHRWHQEHGTTREQRRSSPVPSCCALLQEDGQRTEAIALGPRRPWHHTARRSPTAAPDRATRHVSRTRTEATSSRYGRSGTDHWVPCPRRTLARARRTAMQLAVTWARRCTEEDDGMTRLSVERAQVPEHACHRRLSGQDDWCIKGWAASLQRMCRRKLVG
jgi:hypothetical protein